VSGRAVLAVLALGVLPAVAAAQSTGTSLQFKGFRVTSPAAENWTVLDRNEVSALLGRRTTSSTHTFVAIVMSDSIPDNDVPLWNSVPEYFDFIKKLKRASLDPSRHTLLSDEFTPPLANAPTCIRYRLRAEDKGAQQARGIALPLDITGVSCTHPDSLRTIVDVSYSERGGPSTESARMREEAERFVSSIVFLPLK